MGTSVTVKLEICHFQNRNNVYLGYMIATSMLQVTQKTAKAVEALPYPTDISKARSSSGLCSVYRKIVKNLTRLPPSLNKNEKGAKLSRFKLAVVEREAVHNRSGKLLASPTLTISQREGRYTLKTNAGVTQVWFVLLQEQENKLSKQIGYQSSSPCDAEMRYASTHTGYPTVV